MDKLIKVNYFVDSFVEYKNTGFEFIPANNTETFDASGNQVHVFYKRAKFPTVKITVENTTRTIAEINDKWKASFFPNHTLWGISRKDNNSILYISVEVYSTESAKYFLELCDNFIKEVFHIKE